MNIELLRLKIGEFFDLSVLDLRMANEENIFKLSIAEVNDRALYRLEFDADFGCIIDLLWIRVLRWW